MCKQRGMTSALIAQSQMALKGSRKACFTQVFRSPTWQNILWRLEESHCAGQVFPQADLVVAADHAGCYFSTEAAMGPGKLRIVP